MVIRPSSGGILIHRLPFLDVPLCFGYLAFIINYLYVSPLLLLPWQAGTACMADPLFTIFVSNS